MRNLKLPELQAATTMIEDLLRKKLEPLTKAETRFRRCIAAAVILLVGAAVGAGIWWLYRPQEVAEAGPVAELSPLMTVLLVGVVLLIIAIAAAVVGWRKFSAKDLARKVEQGHPDLQAALLTAVEQKPDSKGEFGYLQERVIYDAVQHAVKHDWVRQVSRRKMLAAGWARGLAVVLFAFVCVLMLSVSGSRAPLPTEDGTADTDRSAMAFQIEVNPGDVEMERGTRLVVEAKFGERVPTQATLVMVEPEKGKEGEAVGETTEVPADKVEWQERGRVVLKPGLDEHMFGGLVSSVDSDAQYWVEYDGERSDTFQIATFEHPKLERADAKVTPPAYSGQEPTEVKNTRKVSALEGSEVAFSLQLNKPVVAAELFGEDETIIELRASDDDPTVLVGDLVPSDTQKYRLHLVDEADRSNKQPPWLTVTVKKNLPATVKMVFPGRDTTVSPVQEMPVEAQVYDDLGVTATGLTLSVKGESREVALSPEAAAEPGPDKLAGGKKHKLQTLLALEEMKAQPRDLLTYYVWAEDVGPDGTTRRAMSDLFFADVRHFEDIFREAESPPPGQGEGGPTDELVDLQKQVINADWKLTRETKAGKTFEEARADVEVIKESQEITAAKTGEAMAEIKDEEVLSHLTQAREHMAEAVKVLERGLETADVASIEAAMTPERQAYESLLRAQSREHNITRSQQPSQGKGQPKEQQLMQLEMKQEDQRYEEESQAQDEQQTAEQEENLVVLNRLKELATRQEALAEKMKELEAQLKEAETEEEKAELRKQLKRLQEEQEQLLRELDELTERMDEPDNRANMAEEREKLEETRENVREAAEKLAEGEDQLADAANAATRAQRELDEVKEEFRERTSKQFAEEMRGVRDRARELAENQQAISEKMAESGTAAPDDPFDQQDQTELTSALQGQREKLAEVLEELQKISEAAEDGEPLLSDALYEAVREAQTGGLEQNLSEAGDWTRFGRMNEARESEAAAGRGIENLEKSVEKAAERILGSESDALRMARSELDRLIDEAEKEVEEMVSTEPGENAGDAESENSAEGQELGEGQEKGEGQGKGEGREPGEGQGKGEGREPGEGQGKGEGREPGEGQGKGEGREPGEGQGKGEGREPGEGQGKGEGREPGEGQGKGEGREPGEGQGKGEGRQPGEGQGKGEGREPGEGQGKGEGQQPGKGQGEGEGQQPGEGQGKGEGRQPGEGEGQGKGQSSQGQTLAGGNSGGGGATNQGGGDDRRTGMPGGSGSPQGGGRRNFFDQPEEQVRQGPLSGENYEEWADRLRSISGMLGDEKLSNEAAQILDQARAMRIDFVRDNLPPQAAIIEQRILDPLVELRDRVAEELARKTQENPLSPIDRDPVPDEYRELVKKYYEQLGGGR